MHLDHIQILKRADAIYCRLKYPNHPAWEKSAAIINENPFYTIQSQQVKALAQAICEHINSQSE